MTTATRMLLDIPGFICKESEEILICNDFGVQTKVRAQMFSQSMVLDVIYSSPDSTLAKTYLFESIQVLKSSTKL